MNLWTASDKSGSPQFFRMPMVIGRGSGGPEANVASGGKLRRWRDFLVH
jgi:hypothetical protein